MTLPDEGLAPIQSGLGILGPLQPQRDEFRLERDLARLQLIYEKARIGMVVADLWIRYRPETRAERAKGQI